MTITTDILRKSGIIPDVLSSFSSSSSATVHVKYPHGTVHQGNQLKKEQTQVAPQVSISGAPKHKYYSLLMTDPDAPSRQNPIRGEWMHWAVLNAVDPADLTSGDTVISYMGPAPPQGTSLHRYVFAVFGHDEPLQWQSSTSESNRPKFKLQQWINDHGVGEPLGVEWFECETL